MLVGEDNVLTQGESDLLAAYEPSFLEARAPYVTFLQLRLERGGGVFSWKMLEAVPELVRVCCRSSNVSDLDRAALEAFTTALRHGALQNIRFLSMCECAVGDGGVREFLEESGCAKRLESLAFIDCEVGEEGVRALTDPLCGAPFQH